MRFKVLAVLLAVAFVATAGVSCTKKQEPVGSAKNPVKFYFMPLKGEEVFKANAPLIEKFIEAQTGLFVDTVYVKDFSSIIEVFGKKDADVAFMNTLGYLLAREWAGAEAHLRYVYGDIYTTYRGEVIAKADGPISQLKDIDGKTIAFSDPYSTSGYLYPLKLLKDNNVKPSKMSFAGGHLKAVEAVYKGETDSAAVYHTRPSPAGLERDARAELASKYPDIIEKVKIVALTSEIPDGPIAFARELPDHVKTRLVGALMEFARTGEGRKALMELYNISGLAMAVDSDYDGVRAVIKAVGKTVQDVVPGGAPFYRTAIEPGLE